MVEVSKGLVRPDATLQFFAGDDRTRLLQQGHQYLQRLILNPDARAGLPQLARACVQLKNSESGRGALIVRFHPSLTAARALDLFTTGHTRDRRLRFKIICMEPQNVNGRDRRQVSLSLCPPEE